MQHSQKKNSTIKLCDNDGCYREEDQKKWGKVIYRKKTRRLLQNKLKDEAEDESKC